MNNFLDTDQDTHESEVWATYRVRDIRQNLEKRASGIAIGLTIGTWTDLPQARQNRVAEHCGRVQSIEVKEEQADGYILADITIAYPVANFDDTFACLLTTVFGKLSMDGQIRLVALEIPNQLARRFPGPAFGVDGCRHRFAVHGRPFVMSIFKACIGLTLAELTDQFEAQAAGGIDLVKDDEIFFTETYASPEDRVVAYRERALSVAAKTGRETAYAVNLTGPAHQLRERARRLSDLGAGALLVNVVAYGFDLVADLAADPDVHAPILAHPAVAGALYGSEGYGIAADIVLGQLAHMAGADMAIFPSMYGSVTLGGEATTTLIRHLRDSRVYKPSLPAPSAGIFPGLVPQLMRDFGEDLILNAGGGIHGHPHGPTLGGRAFREAIEAVQAGVSLEVAAASQTALQAALSTWGGRP